MLNEVSQAQKDERVMILLPCNLKQLISEYVPLLHVSYKFKNKTFFSTKKNLANCQLYFTRSTQNPKHVLRAYPLKSGEGEVCLLLLRYPNTAMG